MFERAIGTLRRWLLQKEKSQKEIREPRRAPRSAQPEVIVHFWDGSAPEGRYLRDISQSGAYIYTSERWYLGTIVRIVLQGSRPATLQDGKTAPVASICIPARVVRHGSDGVAVEFVFIDEEEVASFRTFLAEIPVPPEKTVSPNAMQRKGQALIEFALIVPMVFLLAANVVNCGGFIFAWITVGNAARTGMRYAAGHGSGLASNPLKTAVLYPAIH